MLLPSLCCWLPVLQHRGLLDKPLLVLREGKAHRESASRVDTAHVEVSPWESCHIKIRLHPFSVLQETSFRSTAIADVAQMTLPLFYLLLLPKHMVFEVCVIMTPFRVRRPQQDNGHVRLLAAVRSRSSLRTHRPTAR